MKYYPYKYSKKEIDNYEYSIVENSINPENSTVKNSIVENFNMIDKINNFTIISQITDNIYLSGVLGANDKKSLDKNNITEIINCTKNIPNYFENKLNSHNVPYNYLRIPVDDTMGQNIEQYFNITFDTIDKSIKDNKKILIHCFAGISRSATILIAYFMKKNNWDYTTAYNLIKSKRSIIKPNRDFIKNLNNFKYV